MSGNWTASISRGILPQSTPAVTPGVRPDMMATPPIGPPYRSNIAVVGGVPVPDVDDPIAAVLVFLFLASAAAHMTILQLNKRKGLKFFFSGMLFVLCTLRSIALIVRMVWASKPTSINVAIAASILTQTGSVMVFVINLFFAQRVVRACHASFGWHRVTRLFFRFLIACVVCCLVMLITVTVQSFYTLDPGIRQSDRDVQLFAGTYLALLAFLPVPAVILAALLPRSHHIDKFGTGRWRSKMRLLLFTALIATLGAGFRIGTNFDARPADAPAWYHSRVCYYCFNFVTDLIISAAYLLARFDRRFIIPNGANGPGDYRAGKIRRPLSPTFSSSSGTLHASGSDSEKCKGKGKETDPCHPRRHHSHHVKIKGGENGIPEVPPLKFHNQMMGFSEPTDTKSKADVFGPDYDGGETTDVDSPVESWKRNADSPGNLFSMVDKISDDGGGKSSEDLSLSMPEPAHLVREIYHGETTAATSARPQDLLSDITHTEEINWPFDNMGVFGTPGFHGAAPGPPHTMPSSSPSGVSTSINSSAVRNGRNGGRPTLENRGVSSYNRGSNFFAGVNGPGGGQYPQQWRTHTL
ncbi:hypothetical protein F5X99DRAFT_278957 [Biscogniauxia marginata]|nr:hypothetical protein F5X99DRAFT_278957 [Biscogniauxia marginata]